MILTLARRAAAPLAALVVLGCAHGASAQLFGRPPAGVSGGQLPVQQVQDAGQLVVRIDRLEGQMRTLNGQLEQLQFQNRRLEEQLKKFQTDIEYRLQPGGAGAPRPARRADVGEPPVSPPLAGVTTPGSPPGMRRPPRGDAFDPNAQPAAPGAPRNIGTLNTQDPPLDQPLNTGRPLPGATQLPGGPISLDPDDDPNAPVDISQPRQPRPGVPAQPAPGQPPSGQIIAALPGPPSPKEEYDVALASMRQGQYESAEQGFRSFLQKHPRDRLVPDALYGLGDTYFQRGRYREAAEQYLKLSTDYSKANRAPEGLLRLGMSLKAMGAKEQACGTYGEVGRRYPTAPASVRKRADDEFVRTKC